MIAHVLILAALGLFALACIALFAIAARMDNTPIVKASIIIFAGCVVGIIAVAAMNPA